MIDLRDLLVTVIKPVLAAIDLNSPAAQVLLIGTALAESGAAKLMQVKGPAIGIFQMEPATFQDCIDNYLSYRQPLFTKIKALGLAGAVDPQQMAGNLYLAAAMCRIKYERSAFPLPLPEDAAGMAHLHKIVYNTALGAADEAKNVPLFKQAYSALG